MTDNKTPIPLPRRAVNGDARNCTTCFFSHQIPGGPKVCRRYPPTAEHVPMQMSALSNDPPRLMPVSFFPVVGDDSWCGEYQVKSSLAAG